MVTRLRGLLTAMALSACPVLAVDGIAVSTHWTGGNDNLYGGFGTIVRHTIKAGQVTSNLDLYTGAARYPTLSQDGTQVVFLKQGGMIAMVRSGGGTVIDLVKASGDQGYLEWPAGRCVWYSQGGYSQNGSSELWKVDVDTRAAQRVLTFKKSGGAIVRQWDWGLSRDATRMMIRCNDGDGNFNGSAYGDIFFIKVPSTVPVDFMLGNGGSAERSQNFDGCGAALNPSGTVGVFFGGVGHGGLDFANWWSSNAFLTLNASTLNSWGANMGGSYNRTRWSVNSDEWVCVMSGWANRGDGGSNQVLYNYVRHEQVVVTRNAANSYINDDAGDFWVGDPGSCCQGPVMNLSPTSLAFSWETGASPPAAKPVTITNAGSGTLNAATVSSVAYANGSGWLSVTPAGSGNSQSLQNAINTAGLAAGTYAATVTVRCDNASPATATYTVGLAVIAAQTLRDPENPPDATTNCLQYSCYEGAWSALPPFAAVTPKATGATAGFDISVATRADNVAISFTGYISVAQTGQYTFCTRSDDGSRLWIGSTLVVDNDGQHAAQERCGAIGLKAGKHAITVGYLQVSSTRELSVSYEAQALGIAKVAIPPSILYCRSVENQSPLRITMPNGGETFRVGDSITVTWASAPDSVTDAMLEVSPNDGMDWYLISTRALRPSEPGWGSYGWRIPATVRDNDGASVSLISPQCLIRIQTYDFKRRDVSDRWFTIAPRLSVGNPASGAPSGCRAAAVGRVWGIDGRRMAGATGRKTGNAAAVLIARPVHGAARPIVAADR